MDLSPYPWQRAQWAQLAGAAASGRLPHAILVSGPRGTGVEEFASCLAAHLLCERPPPEGVSCGTCRPCELFAAGSHPDYFRLEPDPDSKSEQIPIGSVREMVHFVYLTRQFGRSRVALAFPADDMNRNAANALLKILEEPPPDSVIILATHRPASLPVTVRSRCRSVQFHESQSLETLQWLQQRVGDAQVPAAELLRHARGAPLLAAELSAEGALAKRVEVLEELVQLRRGRADPIGVAERWSKLGAEEVLVWLLGYVSEAARLKLSGRRETGSALVGHLQGMADELDLAALVAFHDAVLAGWRGFAASNNLNARSLLENLIVGWLETAEYRGGLSR
jgi:DNA polymerase-3 subunit delta'